MFIAELTQAMEMAPGCRHPVSYIMEAADDISYCLADIEDAVEKGIIELDTLKQSLIAEYQRQIAVKQDALGHQDFMSKSIEAADSSARHLAINQQSQFFTFLRVRLIHPLVNHAAKRFIDNIDAVYHGNLNESLLEDGGYEHAITETLKQVAIKQVFCHREVEKLELQGYRIITGLLDNYRSLLALSEDEFSKLVQGLPKTALIETRLFHKLPGKHLATYKRAIEANQYPEFYHRCRLLQDYISGMTDQYALDEYRLLMVLD
jgi:dGTPase